MRQLYRTFQLDNCVILAYASGYLDTLYIIQAPSLSTKLAQPSLCERAFSYPLVLNLGLMGVVNPLSNSLLLVFCLVSCKSSGMDILRRSSGLEYIPKLSLNAFRSHKAL